MQLIATQPEAAKFIVFLNGKPLRHYVAANDKEGWVEVVDIATMAPLPPEALDPNVDHDPIVITDREHDSEELEYTESNFAPITTKRVYGEVSIRPLD